MHCLQCICVLNLYGACPNAPKQETPFIFIFQKGGEKIIPKELQAAEHGKMPDFQTNSALLTIGTRQVLFFFAKPLIPTWMLFVINILRYQDAVHP